MTRRVPACRSGTSRASSRRRGKIRSAAFSRCPTAETVKKAGKDEAGVMRIASTEDRSQLWLAQTPQMFRCGLLMQALREAKAQ